MPALTPIARTGARLVRRFPALERAGLAVVTRVRASRAAREAAARVFDVDVGGSAVFLSAGTLLAGSGVDNLPVAVVSLLGVPEDQVGPIVEEVAREQVLTAGFRPVIVLEGGALGAARRFGYPAELLVARSAWTAEDPWEEYVTARLAAIRRTYQAAVIVSATPDGLGLAGRAVLRSMGPA